MDLTDKALRGASRRRKVVLTAVGGVIILATGIGLAPLAFADGTDRGRPTGGNVPAPPAESPTSVDPTRPSAPPNKVPTAPPYTVDPTEPPNTSAPQESPPVGPPITSGRPFEPRPPGGPYPSPTEVPIPLEGRTSR